MPSTLATVTSASWAKGKTRRSFLVAIPKHFLLRILCLFCVLHVLSPCRNTFTEGVLFKFHFYDNLPQLLIMEGARASRAPVEDVISVRVLEQRSTLTAITTHDDQQPRRQEYYSTTGTKTYSLGYSFRPEWPSRTIDEQ